MLGERKEPIRRADQLRRKRTVGAQTAERRINWQAAPVATRVTWEPRARRAEPRAYRMHSIALGERGAEVQMPAISLSLSPRGAAATIAVMAGFALLFLLTTHLFHAGTPVVRGTNYLSAQSVADASGVEGKSLFLLSADDLSRLLPQHMPGVKQADLSIGWDGAVAVDIQERVPILIWNQGGSAYWVDAEGVIFPAAKPLDGLVPVDVPEHGPLLTLDGKPNIPPEVVENALELTVALPEGSRIVFDTQAGLGIQDPNGWPVYFGDSGDVSAKLAVYNGLLNSLLARNIRPLLVNIADLRQPYYRRAAGGSG